MTPDQKKNYNKQYRIKNKERLKEKYQLWQKENLVKIAKYNREYYKKQMTENYEYYSKSTRNRILKIKYGITLEEYNILFNKQMGCCAICLIHQTNQRGFSMAVDHCHKTNKIRGLLCFMCNTAIGKFQDNPEVLRNALNYLENNRL